MVILVLIARSRVKPVGLRAFPSGQLRILALRVT